MLKKIASVGGITLVSRITGFGRDLVLAAVLGAGAAADAFIVAQRLPSHFRAIFGEGAFNAAFVPSYAKALEAEGPAAARRFASGIMLLLTAALVAVTGAALVWMPEVVRLLAPGFVDEPERFALAVALTRITFPYLLFISLVTLVSGVLNAHDRFVAAAAAPILLNLSVMAALSVSFLFPGAAHAAAWGVTIAGALQLLLVVVAARRAGIMPGFARPAGGGRTRSFLKTLAPAVGGSAGVQLAMFADTIIASLLPTGAVAALYFADRLYQLPVGLIGAAAGTVLLPAMSRRIGAADPAGAHDLQNRAFGFSLALAIPCTVAFLLIPDLVMRGLFMRGAFDAAAASAAGAVLAAYAVGLPAVVLLRSATASFHARSDTVTPVIAAFAGIGVNIALKLVLTGPFGTAGLALSTAVGAWVNLGLLAFWAMRRGWAAPDRALGRVGLAVLAGSALLAVVLIAAGPAIARWASSLPALRNEAELFATAAAGALAYGAVLLVGLRIAGLRLRRG